MGAKRCGLFSGSEHQGLYPEGSRWNVQASSGFMLVCWGGGYGSEFRVRGLGSTWSVWGWIFKLFGVLIRGL